MGHLAMHATAHRHPAEQLPLGVPARARATDERYTPAWLFDAMGLAFALDVAAPAGGVPWIPAELHYSAADDGLARPWRGLVWCNPPFSHPEPWVRKWVEHGSGVLLFPMNVNARWLFHLLAHVPRVVLLEHIRFEHPTHTGRHVPVGIALTALGPGTVALDRVAATGRGRLLAVLDGGESGEN